MAKFKTKKMEKAIHDALIMRAMGYESTETVEEYVSQEDNLTLTKRKVTKKQVPPDTSALKTLYNIIQDNPKDTLEDLTDEELEEEKNKILEMLKGGG